MNKRGRNNILILINILFVLVVIFYFYYNSPTVFDLTESFNLKGEVVQSGTYTDESYNDMINKVQEANNKYSQYEKKAYIAYGNSNEMNIVSYEDSSRGEINVITGKSIERINAQENQIVARKIIPKDNKVKVILNGKEHDFNLKDNENIYFIILENE